MGERADAGGSVSADGALRLRPIAKRVWPWQSDWPTAVSAKVTPATPEAIGRINPSAPHCVWSWPRLARTTKALRDIARVLIGKATDGDIQAIREIADRLDGKPAQMVTSDPSVFRDMRQLTNEELMAIAAGAYDRGPGTQD